MNYYDPFRDGFNVIMNKQAGKLPYVLNRELGLATLLGGGLGALGGGLGGAHLGAFMGAVNPDMTWGEGAKRGLKAGAIMGGGLGALTGTGLGVRTGLDNYRIARANGETLAFM